MTRHDYEMRIVLEPANADRVAPTRMVLLPGAFDGPQQFQQAGFGRAVRSRGLNLDLALVQPDPAHLADRSVLTRLHQCVVLPARAAGCQKVWLAGISLGGLLALAYAIEYPDQVDGLCLLAPYLGNRIISSEIIRAGGLRSWEPGPIGADDEERRVWQFIKSLPHPNLAVHLGYGRSDRFADTLSLMAAAMPAQTVDIVEGGHDWPAWTSLWGNFLDQQSSGAPPH